MQTGIITITCRNSKGYTLICPGIVIINTVIISFSCNTGDYGCGLIYHNGLGAHIGNCSGTGYGYKVVYLVLSGLNFNSAAQAAACCS